MAKTIQSALELTGVFTAIFTPLKNDDPKCLRNTIDYSKAEKMIDQLIAKGISGLVPVGTTGQSATVTPEQHIEFIKFTVDYVANRVPVIAGAGSNSTRESIDTMNMVQKITGDMCFLCVTGYYNNPPQEGLIKHFETLSEETDSNIIIYNVPSRTNSYIEPESIIHLATNDKIIGLKQAVEFVAPGKMREDTIQILTNVNYKKFSVLTGEDNGLYAILNLGGKGIITASGNIPEAAEKFLELIKIYHKGEIDGAESIQNSLAPFVEACFVQKNPIPLAALFNSPVYQPLISVKDSIGGAQIQKDLMKFIEDHAPSLKSFHS